ncbi:hypothetical protein PQQ96_02970 [Paraburkholderia sediminicola]|uniref:hypothetical protein n=1 Tax=Paraburkholderia sediminicola TaxID=458836 RepID=UPI0038BDA80A
MIATFCFTFALLDTATVFAQSSDALTAPASGAAAASTPKQIRKAQRKAARARKNADLKVLEKNGYQPGGDLTSYPQNLQDAERKTAPKPVNATPASGQ